MSVELKVLVSAVAFVALGVVCVHTPWIPGGASAVEAALGARAEAALAADGHDWAAIEVEGRRITLTGRPPHEGARADAVKAVRASSWPGAPLIGGVGAVVDQTQARPAERSPFLLTASKDGAGPVVLRGAVETNRDRARLSERAAALFPEGLEAALDVARGAPEEGDWVQAAAFGLDLLARLESGRLTLSDREIRLSGAAISSERRRLIESFADMAPRPFVTVLNLRVEDAGAAPEANRAAARAPVPQTSAAPVAAPRNRDAPADAALLGGDAAPPLDAEAPAVASTDDGPAEDAAAPAPTMDAPEAVSLTPAEAACQGALQAAAPPGAIGFPFNETQFTAASEQAILAVADVLLACGPVRVVVGGHTDNQGDPRYNLVLSRRRAAAVAERLTLYDLGEAQVSARGFGDAAPIASNATLQGRRANRRISFTVTPSREGEGDAPSQRPEP